MKGLSFFLWVGIVFSFAVIPLDALANPTKKSKVYKTRTGSSIILYKHPTVHSGVSTTVPAKSRWILRLSGIKKYSSSTWYEVSWNGKKGWVNKTKIIFDSLATDIVERMPGCLLSETRSKDCEVSS